MVPRIRCSVDKRLRTMPIFFALDEEYIAHVDGLDFLFVVDEMISVAAIVQLPEVHVGVGRVLRPDDLSLGLPASFVTVDRYFGDRYNSN